MGQQLIPANEWIKIIVLSGIIGTAVMTLSMYCLTFLTTKVMPVARVLGTMITCQTTDDGHLSDSRIAIAVGILAHYAVGIFFAYCYHVLWMFGVGEPGFWNGLLLGLLSGTFAVIFWFTFVAVHPFPPKIDLKDYIPALFLGHFIFASTAVVAYIFLIGKI
ncbi:hypothetical protein [Dyadobacter psychrotolerans]|uniref:DUF1440 domain-containing protein n=1 Tax=Dyadobacter psychrotolerans TaxID=2541721 RepID=A0A4R5DUP7_9BACT|nr:hypothetical protein [Dyadobacter psychrotolerans]TDE18266.1 hypothetical protein E0F88_01620 [Dyadobacter psychrotolerans]